MEARTLAGQHEHSIRQRLDGLTALLRALAPIAGRKTVVVLSGGLLVSDRTSGRPNVVKLAWEVGRVAEQSNVAMYLLHQDDHFLDPRTQNPGTLNPRTLEQNPAPGTQNPEPQCGAPARRPVSGIPNQKTAAIKYAAAVTDSAAG
jgi:hypothetical protein